MTITTNTNETLAIEKSGKGCITDMWGRNAITRTLYKASDGSTWARYDGQLNELKGFSDGRLVRAMGTRFAVA